MVENSSLERKLIQGYVKRLRNKYLLKNIHLTCEEKFIPFDFISSHFDKLSQMVGDFNDTNLDEISKNLSKDDINFGGEMFMALNSCPTFYVKLYWKAIYENESRMAEIASNIVRKANDDFKVSAQKIFAEISSVLGFQHLSSRHNHDRNNSLEKDIQNVINHRPIQWRRLLSELFCPDRGQLHLSLDQWITYSPIELEDFACPFHRRP